MDGSNLKTFLHMWKATYSLYKNRKLILEQLRNAGKEILTKDAILTIHADVDVDADVDAGCASKKMKIYSTLYHPVLHFQIVCTCITDMTMSERSYMKK